MSGPASSTVDSSTRGATILICRSISFQPDVVAVDGLPNVLGYAHRRLDDLPGARSQVLQRVNVQRIRHDDDQRVALEVDGNEVVLAGVLFWHQRQRLLLHGVAREVDYRQVELEAQRQGDVLRRNPAFVLEIIAQALLLLTGFFYRLAQLLSRDQAGVDEDFAQLLNRWRRCCYLGHVLLRMELNRRYTGWPAPTRARRVESERRFPLAARSRGNRLAVPGRLLSTR